MSSVSASWDAIDRRVAHALGPEWETGGVFDVEENSVISPRHRSEKKSLFSVLWPTAEDAEVALGGGLVVGAGQVRGWDFSHRGALDEVVALICEEIARQREPKRSALGRIFGR